jgi:hypothetical protein
MPRKKRPRHEGDHSPPTTVEVNNALNYIFILPRAFEACAETTCLSFTINQNLHHSEHARVQSPCPVCSCTSKQPSGDSRLHDKLFTRSTQCLLSFHLGIFWMYYHKCCMGDFRRSPTRMWRAGHVTDYGTNQKYLKAWMEETSSKTYV